MNKKLLIVIVVVGSLVGIAIVLAAFLASRQPSPTGGENEVGGGQVGVATPTAPKGGGFVILPNGGQEDLGGFLESASNEDINSIDGITIINTNDVTQSIPNNFLKDKKRLEGASGFVVSSPGQDALAISNPEYSINFYPDEGVFIIALYELPLKDTRMKAEQDLLNTLGVGQNEACALPVDVGTITSIDEELAGINLGLSFCPGAWNLE